MNVVLEDLMESSVVLVGFVHVSPMLLETSVVNARTAIKLILIVINVIQTFSDILIVPLVVAAKMEVRV